jgi:hypothetical protein
MVKQMRTLSLKKLSDTVIKDFKPAIGYLKPDEEVACNICSGDYTYLSDPEYYIPGKKLPSLTCKGGQRIGVIHTHRNEDNHFSFIDVNTEWQRSGSIELHCIISNELKTHCYVLNKKDKTVDFGQGVVNQFLTDAKGHWVLDEFEVKNG